MLTVYAIEKSEIYGHGKRAVVWFSGCSLHCKGCINSYLWDKENGRCYTVERLFDEIKSCGDICGVTFIGGEPLEQGKDLLFLSNMIRKADLDIVLFTGYELEELRGLMKKIADEAAVIIYGRYIEELRDTSLLLRGSSNQKILVRDTSLKEFYANECRQVEVEITEDSIKYLGFPEDFI